MGLINSIFKLFLRQRLLRKQHVKVGFNSLIDSASKVGSYSYIGYRCLITNVRIGRYVSIANNVSIGMGEHPIGNISTNVRFMKDPSILVHDSVTISDDVWIGENVKVLRGVSLGRGCVIGAGAVVTKNIPPYSIAVGVPAKVMRMRFTEDIIELIENSYWWEKEADEAKKIISELEQILLEK